MLQKFKNPLIDNSQNYKLSSYIKTLLLDENYNEFYIATGYWDIPSVALIFEEFKTFLERPDTKIKLLLGKDPEVQNYQLSHADEIDLNNYPASYIKYHLDNIPVVADYEDAISLLLNYCVGENPKFEIHTYQDSSHSSFLHAKCYIFKGKNDSCAIVGSSNFTKKGLEDNSELNYLEMNSSNVVVRPENGTSVKGHIFWFDEKWKNSKSWGKIFIYTVLKTNIGCRSFSKGIENKFISEKKKLQIEKIQNGEIENKMNIPRIPSDITLFDYQNEAISEWEKQNYKGIFDMATGTGKTLTGLGAVSKLSEVLNDRLAVFIVCPYQHLVEQWVEDIEQFGMKPIIGYSSSEQKNWKSLLKYAVEDFNLEIKNKTFFCFISTNATFSSEFVQNQISKLHGNALLVVDEAHNFGAEYLRKLLSNKFSYRLALSATLERHGDKEGTQSLYDYFGKKCIEYGLERAIKEKKLTRYKYYPVVVSLTDDEFVYYEQYSREISKCVVKGKNGKLKLNEKGKRIALQRARLVAGAANKIGALKEQIMPYINDNHILVYCGATKVFDENSGLDDSNDDEISEGKRQIEVVTDLLGNLLGMKVAQFTSKENMQERAVIKQEFSEGKNLQALIAIKCLDEGVNIPAIKTAFILASTTNPKEYIQRRGRVLRKSDGKDFAEIYDFITLPRPLTEVIYETEEQKKKGRTLVINELVRAIEFARLSMTEISAMERIEEIKKLYELTDKDLIFKEDFENEQ